MLERSAESAGPVVGYKIVGKVTADDYALLDTDVQALVDQFDDDVRVLLDMQAFAGEEAKSWRLDLEFGRRYHDKIARMAIIGDKIWEEWMTALAEPFFAKDAKFFHPQETSEAWAWLREDT